MKKNLILFLTLFSFCSIAYGETIPIRKFTKIKVSGVINPGTVSYIQMGIDKTVAQGGEALIVELDTPGGLLSSTRDIVKAISLSPVPLVIFVYPGGARATSAGAIISIASHIVVMAPGTNIGAATPVVIGGSGEQKKDKEKNGDMERKMKNDTAAFVRAQATLRGRNVDLADEIVNKAVSLSAKEALEKDIIDYIAKDMNDLLLQLDGKKLSFNSKKFVFKTKGVQEESITFIDASYAQKFLSLIANPTISTMLMALGGLCIYIFVNSGFSSILAGAIGFLSIILAFISFQTIPINVGAIALLLLGIVLLIAEVFVTSFGFLAVAGMAAIAAGSIFLVDTTHADIQVSLWLVGSTLFAITVIVFVIGFLFSREKRIEGGYDPFHDATATVRELDEGNRSGKVFINGEIWNFISEEEVKLGDEVKISKKQGLTLTVKKS